MGLLDKLWDDTVAGPQPDTGLSKLRKPASFSIRSISGKEEQVDEPRVTRSIMIKKPAGSPSTGNGTPPTSPAGSTPPVSPFSGGKQWNRFRRKSSSDAYEQGAVVDVGPRNPPPPYEN
ncbi:Dormancy/auxin associated protein [Dioscorea alata]|uniref:Dormancy/auxin associated protein n=1 Tax=Dioscorea alata TaxID=55571 RepID=A0ACB7VQG0_DIOAL|nr:Dormancy/auxin associated protein [Dioscorea alata]